MRAWFAPYRPATRASARWLATLLDVQPADDVLDVAPVGGYSTTLIAARLVTGRVVVVDPSKAALDVTHFHLRRHVRSGRASLVRTEPANLPRFDVAFDKVLISDVNRLPSGLPIVCAVLRERMTPGGRILLARRLQDAASAQSEAARLAKALADVGFAQVETHLSLPTACAMGRRSS